MKNLLVLFLIFLTFEEVHSHQYSHKVVPTQLKEVIIIRPTGMTEDGLPEMMVLSDTTTLYKTVMDNIENSFINDFLDLYFLAQIYLRNLGELDHIEPAYLALTENQGGFAKFGFSIKAGREHIEKRDVPYVDITIESASSNPDRLMSFTQLYPHEMGHVLYHLLSPEDSLASNTRNVDMHFFSVVTDFSTAFNEGFAEHIENVSRDNERNTTIREGISADLDRIAKNSNLTIDRFERDFIYPIRLGYYKVSMLSWYQQYEDYKRAVQATNGDVRYKSANLRLSNIEDQLSYRNSGVRLNRDEPRNRVQLLSTEGAISAFFTHLSKSKLINEYADAEFYKPFLHDSSLLSESPKELFTPLQNQFLKYFKVLHEAVVLNNSARSQLTDFIDGYSQFFPNEEEKVKSIFREALGMEYSNELPPPLWLMVKNYEHRLLTFDPFGAITVPAYTFDLNAAEVEDLQTIEGVGRTDAEKIIRYRRDNGFFQQLNEVKDVPGLTIEVGEKVIQSKFELAYFEELLGNFEPKLSIAGLVMKPLQYLFTRILGYFIIVFAIVHFYFRNREKQTVRKNTGLFFRFLLLSVLMSLIGLILTFLGNQAILYYLFVVLLMMLIAWMTYRKRRVKWYRTASFIILISITILLSMA